MLRFLITGVVLGVAAVTFGVLWSPGGGDVAPVEAHGTVDQSQTTGDTQEFNGIKPMQQSFRPTTSSLVAVDLKVSSAFSDYPDLLWTVAIRSSFEYGPIIGLATMHGLTYNPAVVHVDLPSPITVVPGDTYWIEVGGENNYLQWNVQLSTNPYPDGSADSEVEQFYPGSDRWFVTYSGPSATPTPSPTPLVTARPTRTPIRH